MSSSNAISPCFEVTNRLSRMHHFASQEAKVAYTGENHLRRESEKWENVASSL
ncbi:hypothetical protein MTR_0003s0610 [Medicago truncatula]|uniref:Uncharacterized protein n=1 Tax=Medicago truncatula TaxID=3880 RepID=A0A072TJR1_MEDTR|nr:hypothetical protein MTR_0003s0610 [Medicago truncatula]